MEQLQLLVLNDVGDEVYVNSAFKFTDICGWYLCPDDESVINILIYGNSYLVVRTEYLMDYLHSNLNK